MNDFLYFFLSGEHPTLPKAEILSILDAEEVNFKERGQTNQLYKVKAPIEILRKVYTRSGMCRSCGIEIFSCMNDFEKIIDVAKEIDFTKYINSNETFSVRVTRVSESARDLSSSKLERILGKIIQGSVEKAKVNLSNPKKRLQGILTGDMFLLGLNVFKKRESLMQRRPRKRPAFHPATMEPKLARCMVNLARTKKDSFMLDPFCGVGGILIEAGLLGCKILGCDLNTKMIEGARRNLEHFNLESEGIILSDARRIPFTPINSIATDPPYGKNSSSFGIELTNLFRDFILSVYDTLDDKGYISISLPSDVDLRNFAEEVGLKLVEVHNVYVHRSLTREIFVFKR